jgi:hypothetical protein
MQTIKFKKEIERLYKPIKELDAEIRTIENEQHEDKSIYWIVEVGMLESIGEQGYIETLFFDEKPTEEQIKQEIKDNIKRQIERLNEEFCLGCRDETHLEKLKEIKI